MNWPALFRQLATQRFVSAVSILGLAGAFAAALLIALFVRGERNYDSHWPDAHRIYLITSSLQQPGKPLSTMMASMPDVAPRLESALGKQVELTRWTPQFVSLRRGGIEMPTSITWVGANFFDVFQMTPIAGELDHAMTQPQSMVLTESAARRLFGSEPAVGATVEMDRSQALRVVAVVPDLPRDTHLKGSAFVSGSTSGSPLADGAASFLAFNTHTYFKLRDGTPVERVTAAIDELVNGHYRSLASSMDLKISLIAIPIREAHMMQPTVMVSGQGNPLLLDTLTIIGVMIVLAAAVNFVNLMTAQAAYRSVEIGVRKIHGASRADLVRQFVGETTIYAAIAMVVAISIVELALPALRGFLGTDLTSNYVRDWVFWACVIAASLAVGAMAGLYPALVLASFPPVGVLKGNLGQKASAAVVRRVLVVVQFAVLTVLLFSTLVVMRQMNYAMNEGLQLDKRNVIVVLDGCDGVFVDEVRRLPGVRAAACSQSGPAMSMIAMSDFQVGDGTSVALAESSIQPGFFELYGLRPSAGSFLPASALSDPSKVARERVVLNEAAVKRLGFRSADAAIGARITALSADDTPSEIIGVVPDFPTGSIREAVAPQVFLYDPSQFNLLSIKLMKDASADVAASIDALWGRLNDTRPIVRMYVEEFVAAQFQKDLRQSALFAIFAFVAMLIACFGLYALAISITRRRTKEVGIRKALGASSVTIVRLLIWDFSKPVILAVVIAVPIGSYLMTQWLTRFPARISLSPWMFVASAMLVVVVAWLSVGFHAASVARSKPIVALKYA